MTTTPVLVSACLLGLNTRYNGEVKSNRKVLDYLKRQGLTAIPVCPEQLGGLPTPRPATEFSSGDGREVLAGQSPLVNAAGVEVGAAFIRGAEQTLRVARLSDCRLAIFKERSPSCGRHKIHCHGAVCSGQGVTTTLLLQQGLKILSEEDIPEVPTR